MAPGLAEAHSGSVSAAVGVPGCGFQILALTYLGYVVWGGQEGSHKEGRIYFLQRIYFLI